MSVVANEQVINGYCERHPDTKVEQRFLEQWFFAITRYAQRLLENLDRLDWSDSTRTLQRNWIGRSEGAELVFETPAGAKITVYTTRPDTVFGATYMVLAPEHPLVDALTTEERHDVVNAYRREVLAKDLAPVGVHHVVPLLGRERVHEGVLGREHHVGGAEHRVRPGGVDGDLRAGRRLEHELRALAPADPVALQRARRVRPIEPVEILEQPLGIAGDREEPL